MTETSETDYEQRLSEAQREVEAAADNLERAADQLEGALRIGGDDGAMETLNHRLQAARRRNLQAGRALLSVHAERMTGEERDALGRAVVGVVAQEVLA